MNKDYDNSWDSEESSKGNLPFNEELFDRKYQQWEKRDWMTWLEENLSFPFDAERVEEEDDGYFTNVADRGPFRLGHIMTVLDFEFDDDLYGIIVKVKEKKRIGHVPLCDLQVTPKSDKNYWHVREYVVWFANS